LDANVISYDWRKAELLGELREDAQFGRWPNRKQSVSKTAEIIITRIWTQSATVRTRWRQRGKARRIVAREFVVTGGNTPDVLEVAVAAL
jgi:hypothetical protein